MNTPIKENCPICCIPLETIQNLRNQLAQAKHRINLKFDIMLANQISEEQFHQRWEKSSEGWQEKPVKVEALHEIYDYDA
jgi:hypothetical protein